MKKIYSNTFNDDNIIDTNDILDNTNDIPDNSSVFGMIFKCNDI